MGAYPQLLSGSLSQFPLVKRIDARTVVNRMSDGSTVKLADPNGGTVGWQLQYANLTDTEATALQQFFAQCEGSLNGFTLADPAGNLLAWSEDFTNAAWQAAPLLAVTGGANDPFGGTQAFTLTNSAGAAQGISQTLNTPGGYLYTLSVYLQAGQATPVMLSIGTQSNSVVAGPDWARFSFAASGDESASSITVEIECTQGSVVVFGPQVEVQPSASAYQKSTTGGVYENARFQNDSLQFTSTGPNRNSVTVNIIYANHL